jgi:hypothetical protein
VWVAASDEEECGLHALQARAQRQQALKCSQPELQQRGVVLWRMMQQVAPRPGLAEPRASLQMQMQAQLPALLLLPHPAHPLTSQRINPQQHG